MKTAQGCKLLTDWLPPRDLTDEEIANSHKKCSPFPDILTNGYHLHAKFMREATPESSSSPQEYKERLKIWKRWKHGLQVTISSIVLVLLSSPRLMSQFWF